MTEELKSLIDIVADLPGATLWVLAGFAAFKLITYLSTTGSVVFILKLAIEKLYLSVVRKKEIEVNCSDKFVGDGEVYKSFLDNVVTHLRRKRNDISYSCLTFLYEEDVSWFKEAIDEKFEREAR